MEGIIVRNAKQWPRGCCFYFWLPLKLSFSRPLVAKLHVLCCLMKGLMERYWRRSREENLGVSRDGGDEASNYPVEPTPPSRLLLC